jgi:hypothetical protein
VRMPKARAPIQKREGQNTRMPQDPKGSSGIALRLMRRVNVPRAPSLELYVLPNGGGQLLSPTAYNPIRMELRGIEPLTSAVRLQRSPN